MNMKNMIRLVGSAVSAGSALKTLSRAKNEGDRLKMLEAAIAFASVAVSVAVVVRDMRDGGDQSRLVELKDSEENAA